MDSLDDKPGNTELLGRFFWRIENNNAKDALDKCYAWASFHERDIDILSWYNLMVREDSRMACPCTEWQAWFDSRFIWEWRFSWLKLCYRSRRSKSFTYYIPGKGLVTIKITQKCCYSTEWPGDWAALKKGPPDGSRVHVQTVYHWSDDEEETFTDEQAYKYCCVDIPLCKLFYHYRPSDNCDLYIPPPRRKNLFLLFLISFIYLFIYLFVFSCLFVHLFVRACVDGFFYVLNVNCIICV